MSLNPYWADTPNDVSGHVSDNAVNQVVLIVDDDQDGLPELKQILQQKGYRVIDTDNGQDAAREARRTHPDLLLVDLDVPLLYELVAAQLIIEHAQVGPLPVVIVTHEDVVDPAPMMEVGATRNEYVTRLSNYEELKILLDYLLPVMSPADAGCGSESSRGEPVGLSLLAASAPTPRLRRAAGLGKPESFSA